MLEVLVVEVIVDSVAVDSSSDSPTNRRTLLPLSESSNYKRRFALTQVELLTASRPKNKEHLANPVKAPPTSIHQKGQNIWRKNKEKNKQRQKGLEEETEDRKETS